MIVQSFFALTGLKPVIFVQLNIAGDEGDIGAVVKQPLLVTWFGTAPDSRDSAIDRFGSDRYFLSAVRSLSVPQGNSAGGSAGRL